MKLKGPVTRAKRTKPQVSKFLLAAAWREHSANFAADMPEVVKMQLKKHFYCGAGYGMWLVAGAARDDDTYIQFMRERAEELRLANKEFDEFDAAQRAIDAAEATVQ